MVGLSFSSQGGGLKDVEGEEPSFFSLGDVGASSFPINWGVPNYIIYFETICFHIVSYSFI